MPRYTLSILWLALILILCWLPQSAIVEPNWLHFPNQDKVIHFTLFFVWVYFLNKDIILNKRRFKWFIIVVLGLSIAFTTEYLQPIISNRDREWQDGVADIIGVVIGLFLLSKKK